MSTHSSPEVISLTPPVALEATHFEVPRVELVRQVVVTAEVLTPAVTLPSKQAVSAEPVKTEEKSVEVAPVPLKRPIVEPKAPKASEAPAAPVEPETPVKPTTLLVRKPSALKPAVKISRTAMTTAQVKLAVQKSVAKAPALKDKLQTAKLKERGSNLKKSALGAAILTGVGVKLVLNNSNKLSDKALSRGKTIKTSLVEKKDALKSKDTTKFRETIANAPYLAKAVVKNRFTDLNESMYQRKGMLVGAIGLVAVTGLAYAAFKNIDLSGSAPLVEASDPTLLDPSAGTLEASERITGPAKPTHGLLAVEQVTASADQAPATSFEDIFIVEGGEGIVENIIDDFAQEGINLDASEAYQIYQELDVKLDGNLINGDTYRMSNGDLGISNAGQFGWQQEMQNALEEIAKEKKKKKS